MSMVFGFDILPGIYTLRDQLKMIAKRATNLTPAFLEVISSFHKMEARTFEVAGPGWQDISQATKDYKANNGFEEGILVRTGALRTSLTTNSASSYTWFSMGAEAELFMGTHVRYAQYHQLADQGYNIQRKFINLNQATAYLWGFICAQYLIYGEAGAAAAGRLTDTANLTAYF